LDSQLAIPVVFFYFEDASAVPRRPSPALASCLAFRGIALAGSSVVFFFEFGDIAEIQLFYMFFLRTVKPVKLY
jgi:hypothetical protein